MKFKVQVEEFTFYINVGQGYNDFAWFSLVAAKLYSNKKNPDSNYLPCFLQFRFPETDMFLTPPPRAKIFDYLKEDEEGKETLIQVEIRKGLVPMSEEQEKWYNEAFGKMRNQFTVTFQLAPLNQKILNRQEPLYLIQYEYRMFQEVQHEFDVRQYPVKDKIILKEVKAGDNFKKYFAEITLPLGQLTYQFYGQITTEKEGQEPQQQLFQLDMKNFDQNVRFNPVPVSQQEIQKKIMEHAQQQEQLVEQLKQQEKDNLKDKQPTQLCPYKFQKLWTIIENNADGNLKLTDLEENLYNKIYQYMEQRLPQLYEVFYQYTLLYNQDIEKKDEISIPFQDVMHFLKFYGLTQDSSQLFSFIEIYDPDGIKSNDVRNSLQLSVKFPEFIVIIVKLAQFRKTNNLVDVETQDQLIKQIVDKIIQIHLDETEFNHFQIHMKFNEALINFLRENQEQLQKIFINRLTQGNDGNHDIKCHIRREEIKQLIQDSGYKGDNLDIIIDTGYKELFNDEKYQGFEGLFYYEFLQVMQWLALVLIQNDERNQQEETDEVGSLEELQEKLLYFIKCIEI